MIRTSLVLAAGLVFFAAASPAHASAGGQSAAAATRWEPWFGCWQLTEESVDDGSAPMARMLGVPPPTSSSNPGARVCVTPTAKDGATLTTYVNSRSVLTETIVADGSEQPLSEPDCRGWQRAEWSGLGARLFASAEIACADQPKRKVSGMAMLMAGPIWIDIQMIESQGQKNLRVRRYRRAADQSLAGPLPSARRGAMPLGSKLSIADVKEAHAKIAPEVLQAALVELKGGFDLNSKRLLELAKAGVARGVIDLMVALSFPQRFVVERPSAAGGSILSGYDNFGFGELWPYFAQPYFYTSYYAPFGYRYWGYYDPYYFQGPGFVILDPGQGVPNQPIASGEGRVVDGFGYTRVRRNQPEGSTGRSDGGSFGTSSAGGSSSGSSSGGSGGVSSQGYSGGGGGGERTAQPRPPGR